MPYLFHYARILLTRTTIAFVLFTFFALSFVALADEVHENSTTELDDSILRAINSFSSPTGDSILLLVTHLGGILFVPALTASICAVLWKKGYAVKTTLLGLSVVGSALINLLAKRLFERSRPELWTQLVTEHSFSFPSGHAMASSSLAFGLLVVSWNTRYRWLTITLGVLYTLLVGFSRLYLGVHYPTDVVGGWLLSAAWVCCVWLIWKTRKKAVPDLKQASRSVKR